MRKAMRAVQLALVAAMLWVQPAWAAGVGENVKPASYEAPQSPLHFNLTPSKIIHQDNGVYVFSAPPRGSLQEESALYEPIINYLSRVTGKKIVYRYSSNWLSYSRDMTAGRFDLVFDGPHFNGWREANLGHVPLVRLPEPFVFVTIALAGNARVTNLSGLVGKPVCAHAPPNLGTLILLHQYQDPLAQPIIVDIHGWKNAYQGLIQGRCIAAVLPLKNLQEFEGQSHVAKVIYRAPPLPNQALSAGPRVSQKMRAEIRAAMLAPAGQNAARNLRQAYAAGDFVAATRAEYAGLGNLLAHSLYYQ